MGEVEETLYIHILEQTLLNNTIMISHAGLAETYHLPLAEVLKAIDGLISDGYLLKLGEGYYSVKFSHLDEIRA